MCFFFLFLVVFNSFFTTPVEIENARLQLALLIPTGAPITIVSDSIEMVTVATDQTIITYQNRKSFVH